MRRLIGARSYLVETGMILACITAAYVFSIVEIHPTNLFGLTGDDAIYLSSAKSLAEGKGYALPSLPGNPPATKYPILYPLALSAVWRLAPSFPANLPFAIAISAFFGVGFLGVAFAMFLSIGGLTKREAIILTTYCALHPLVVFLGGSILSDMSFAFFALASMTVAERVMWPNGSQFASMGCGALAGISALTRILGFPIILGIVVTGVLRRSWRQVAAFSLAATPFVLAAAWPAIFSKRPPSPIEGAAGASLGWTHAWTFYTDYLGIWKLGVPSFRVFWEMIKNNAAIILRQPADLLLGPTLIRNTILGRALVLIAAAAVVTGIVRQARKHGWKPIHFSLGFYCLVLLFWNYPDAMRFFLPFWPLLIAGAWIEGRRVLRLASLTISTSPSLSQKCLAYALGLVIVALAGGTLENAAGGTRAAVKRKSDERAALLPEKQECYAWIRSNSDPHDRLIAYEDTVAYLYTGRQTVQPMIFTTDEFYAPERLKEAGSHLFDIAQAIGARYWLFSPDDFANEWSAAKAIERDGFQRLRGELPLKFRVPEGSVVVRSVPTEWLLGRVGRQSTSVQKDGQAGWGR